MELCLLRGLLGPLVLWLESSRRIFDDKQEDIVFLWDSVKFWVALWVVDVNYFKGVLLSFWGHIVPKSCPSLLTISIIFTYEK